MKNSNDLIRNSWILFGLILFVSAVYDTNANDYLVTKCSSGYTSIQVKQTLHLKKIINASNILSNHSGQPNEREQVESEFDKLELSHAESCCFFTIPNVVFTDFGFQDEFCIINQTDEMIQMKIHVKQPIALLLAETNYHSIRCSKGHGTLCDSAQMLSNAMEPQNHQTYIPLVNGGRTLECESQFIKPRTKVAHNVTYISDFAPVIFGSPEVKQLVHDNRQKINLICRYYGSPEPIVTWSKDNVTFEQTSNKKFRNDTFLLPSLNISYSITFERKTSCTFESTFRIQTMNIDSVGKYECRVDNAYGTSRTSYHIEAISPEIFTQKEKRFNVTGFIIGMLPPLAFSFYFIMKLGYRSRYAVERPEDDEQYEEQYFPGY